jgi:hypothetical protein
MGENKSFITSAPWGEKTTLKLGPYIHVCWPDLDENQKNNGYLISPFDKVSLNVHAGLTN